MSQGRIFGIVFWIGVVIDGAAYFLVNFDGPLYIFWAFFSILMTFFHREKRARCRSQDAGDRADAGLITGHAALNEQSSRIPDREAVICTSDRYHGNRASDDSQRSQ
jgi:hypothetical protein